LYGINTSNEQTLFTVSGTDNKANVIPIYVTGDTFPGTTKTGTIRVAYPKSNQDAVPKQWVEEKLKDYNTAISFDDYQSAISYLNAEVSTTYKVGANVLIRTLEVPDLWISEKASSKFTYTYVSDEEFVEKLKTDGKVRLGYYWVSALETQKVDLTDYAKISELPIIPTNISAFNNDVGYLTEHQDLSEYAKKSELPTKVSQLTNDKNYLTQHQSISHLATTEALKAVENRIPTKTSQLTNDSGYLTEHQDLSAYAKKTDIPTKVSVFTNDAGYLTKHQDISGKADKATTLAGYGITDACTKQEVNAIVTDLEDGDIVPKSASALKLSTPTQYSISDTSTYLPSKGLYIIYDTSGASYIIYVAGSNSCSSVEATSRTFYKTQTISGGKYKLVQWHMEPSSASPTKIDDDKSRLNMLSWIKISN
jgi:hypothetical protein